MKKKVAALTGILILLGIGMTLRAEVPQDKECPREQLRDALQIRQQMREIEKKTIENDAELQGIMEQIKGLHKQLKEKMDVKLANDAEYQNLKVQMKAMEKEWKGKRGENRKPGERPLPPRRPLPSRRPLPPREK